MRKAPRARRGAERTVGIGSDTCGVVRGVTPFLCGDPVYQQAAGARSSGFIGVGGDAQVCARVGALALASALAAMRKDATDGEANQLPFAWQSQPDRKGCRRRQRGNGSDQRVGSRNRRESGAVGYASRCQRSGSWRSGGAAVPPPAATDAAGSSASQAPRQRVGDECRRRLMRMLS